jgi:hypothetical protein
MPCEIALIATSMFELWRHEPLQSLNGSHRARHFDTLLRWKGETRMRTPVEGG